jgi:SAM-dependent methyltransferase
MDEPSTGSATVNGKLWGARARDWAAIQEPQFRPLYDVVLGKLAVGPSQDFLDVGCGAGLAAQMAAGRGAAVAGVDAAEELIAIAHERIPHGDFHVGDIEELPFPDKSFDAVAGFNSLQFAANPARALAEAKRVVRRGAPIAIVTWASPEGMDIAQVVARLQPLLPPPPPGAPAPFALSDEAELKRVANEAGLEPVAVFDVDCPWVYADLDTAIKGLDSSGRAERARVHSGDDAVSKAHREALTPFRRADGSYRLGATFRCLLAR